MKMNFTDTRNNASDLRDLRPGDFFYIVDPTSAMLYVKEMNNDTNKILAFNMSDLSTILLDAYTTAYTYQDVKIDFTI